MKVFGLQFDKQNIQNSNEIQRRVAKLMTLSTNKLVKLAESEGITIEEDYPLNLDNYPKYKKMVDKEMGNLVRKISQELSEGAKTQWELANAKNDSLVKQFLGRVSVPEDILKSWNNPNLKAFEVFQNRKINGRNLSDRVWETAEALKGNLGMALDVALGDGKSANELSRDIRKYLIEPEKLFRRVRDKHGGLHLSKEAKKYSPGAGVYRSSYKNAMRLARTEINSAYRTADNLRIQKLDFVVGIEIRRSNNVFDCDVCSSLVGKYPKEFNFTGWHPQCRCFALTILSTKDEFVDEMKALLNGEQTNAESENTIKEMPPNFNKWLEDNKESIERSIEKGTEPYWMKDNAEIVKNAFENSIAEEVSITDAFSKSGVDIKNVVYSESMSLDLKNEYEDTIQTLLGEYNLGGKTIKGGVELRFSSDENTLGFIRREKNTGDIMLINFGHTTDKNFGDNRTTNLFGGSNTSLVDKDKNHLSTVVHEFAHIITSSTLDSHSDFWEELLKIRNSYYYEIEDYIDFSDLEGMNKMYLGKYANTNEDEFMAEAFKEYKLNSTPSPYAIKVGELIDKYFKK